MNRGLFDDLVVSMMRPMTQEELIKKLRTSGLRVTPQRELILAAFVDNENHLSAEQIFEKVRHRSPNVNIATVYRNLEILHQYGILSMLCLPGGPLEWELLDNMPHHHLICERCNTVVQISDEVVQQLADRLIQQYGFRPNLKHLALSGLCADCAAKG